jgi:hypothetical protein
MCTKLSEALQTWRRLEVQVRGQLCASNAIVKTDKWLCKDVKQEKRGLENFLSRHDFTFMRMQRSLR